MNIKTIIINIFYCTAVGLVVALLGACSDESDGLLDAGSGAVLRLSTGSFTRASDAHYNDDQYAEHSEEAIKRVDIFFFDKAYSDESPTTAFYVCELNVDEICTADLTIRIPAKYLEKFSNGATENEKEGYAYALVNLPQDVIVDTENVTINGKQPTMKALHQLWVSAPEFVNSPKPNAFVMRGGSKIDVRKFGNWQATGSIMLERLAAKVRLFAEVPSIIYIGEDGNTIEKGTDETEEHWQQRIKEKAKEFWKPAPDGEMKIYFYNAATKGRIDAFIDTENRSNMAYHNVDRSSSSNIIRSVVSNPALNDADKDSKYSYSHTVPYYSYPNIWSGVSPTEEYMTYVVIEVPWKRTATADGTEFTESRKCYYQVPVNAIKSETIEANRLEPNKYYRIKIRLAAFGDSKFDTPMELSASYEVLNWGEADVDVNIKGKRYLVVNQKEWTMNNESYLEIPFSTSHKTIVEECYVTYFRYNDVWGTDPDARPSGNQYPNNNHNKNEWDMWLKTAEDSLENGRNGEGKITMPEGTVTDNKKDDILYYKKEYFYDDYYRQLEGTRGLKYNGGFHYYVGHEHPITFHPSYIKSNNQPGWSDFTERYGIDSVYTCKIDDNRNVIMLNHPLVQMEPVRTTDGKITGYKPTLNPRGNKLWDEYSRVDITIKIRHEDWDTWDEDGLYVETIHVTQYPGIYITVSHDYAQVNGNNYKDKNAYIFVDGYDQTSCPNGTDEVYKFYFVENRMTNNYESNTNPNMYLIHTTQLSEDYNNYIIGDPRMLFVDNYLSGLENYTNAIQPSITDATDAELSSTGHPSEQIYWKGRSWGYSTTWGGVKLYDTEVISAAAIEGGRRRLINYYPTDESSLKENFIAPTFRIASSFGRTVVNGRAEMRRRCASYQEAGRPAGRWRVPSKAEIRYIAQLSADGKIPILFGSTENPNAWGYYWSAQGGVQVNGIGQVENSTGDPGVGRVYPPGVLATRCVYDEWYWNRIDGGEFPEVIRPKGPLETTFYWGDQPKDNTQQ